jgi:hypothetical protein
MSNNKLWFQDITLLYSDNNYLKFFPTSAMNITNKLNASVRLSIYIGLVLTIIYGNMIYLYIPIIMMGVSYIIFMYHNNIEKYKTNKNKKKKRKNEPNVNNPFMNYNILTDNRQKEAAPPSYNNPIIKENIETKFNHNLYKDVGDLYGRNNSQRQFITNPVTEVVNDQTAYAKWLYDRGPTCKEKTINCLPSLLGSIQHGNI